MNLELWNLGFGFCDLTGGEKLILDFGFLYFGIYLWIMAGNFETLQCWQACFKLKVYLKDQALSSLPKSERFELHSQILRSSRSATANIAEGWGRFYYKENIKFLLNARGSVAEILDHSIEAKTWDYINDETLSEIRNQTNSCIRLINGYIKFLRKEGGEK